MPRKARLVVPGAVYHIMGRCIEHYKLFSEDADREHFLYLLETCLKRTNTRCYAWVVMDTHYHLVLRIGDIELWEVMKPLNMRYAQYHKIKTGRRGPLFMDRYKSIVTQDQKYIQELVRYVHLNPVRAGVCRDVIKLNRYPWSGHSVIMGRIVRKFQDTKTVLHRFGRDPETARSEYFRFMQSGMKESTDEDALITLVRKSNAGCERGRKPGCWVIGDNKYVRSVMEKSESRLLRISRFEREGGSFEKVTKMINSIFKIDAGILQTRQRGGNGSHARKAFAYVLTREYNAPVHHVADYLGVSNGAVSKMIHAGKKIVEEREIVI